MRKVVEVEDTQAEWESFFGPSQSGAVAVLLSDPPEQPTPKLERVLDSFLLAVRWIFLYTPGAVLLHMTAMGLALLTLYGDWSIEIIGGSAAAALVGTFMITIGIGRLSDLRYLKVAAGAFSVSLLLATIYAILAAFVPGAFFGEFFRWTTLIPVAFGVLIYSHLCTADASSDDSQT